MKNLRPSFFLILLLSFITVESFPQSTIIAYSYDNAGNMTAKVINLTNTLNGGLMSVNNKSVISDSETESEKAMIKDETFENNEIRIFPNPTKGAIKIVLPSGNKNDQEFQVSVYDSGGRLVVDKGIISSVMDIDLSTQSVGIYFLHIKNGNRISVWKVIKQ